MADSRSILLNVDCESQLSWFYRVTGSTLVLIYQGHALQNSLEESRFVQQKLGFRSALWAISVRHCCSRLAAESGQYRPAALLYGFGRPMHAAFTVNPLSK